MLCFGFGGRRGVGAEGVEEVFELCGVEEVAMEVESTLTEGCQFW